MPDSNGLSQWAQRDERYQLQPALRIFLEQICQGWMIELMTREIMTLKDFANKCREVLRWYNGVEISLYGY